MEEGLSAICAHTNLDIAAGGVNDCLSETLGLVNLGPFEVIAGKPGESIGRIGDLREEMSPDEFAGYVAHVLFPAGGVRYVPGNRRVKRVAVCGGSGGNLAGLALQMGADALVTSEVKHNVFLDCAALGLTLIDAGHHDTEQVVLVPLAQRLASLAPQVSFILSAKEVPIRRA